MKSFCKTALIGFLTSFALGQDAPKKTIEEEKPSKPALGKEATVIMSTSLGDVHIELDSKNAPITVENFLKYVDAKRDLDSRPAGYRGSGSAYPKDRARPRRL